METINDKFSRKTKYDNQKESKQKSFKFLNERFNDKNCTVIIGDSIVEMYPADFFFDYAMRTGNRVFNRGIGGDTSDRMYERLIDNAINLKPRNIVILIGTNDIGIGAPVEFTFCNIEKSINLIRETSPETNIILQAVYPTNKSVIKFGSPVGLRGNDKIKELNERLERLAQSNDVTFLDLTDALDDNKERLSKEYTFDGLHLNAKGYEIVTNRIIPLLK